MFHKNSLSARSAGNVLSYHEQQLESLISSACLQMEHVCVITTQLPGELCLKLLCIPIHYPAQAFSSRMCLFIPSHCFREHSKIGFGPFCLLFNTFQWGQVLPSSLKNHKCLLNVCGTLRLC